jgi:hypothetical protein
MLLIVAHAMRHVHREHAEIKTPVSQPLPSSPPLMMTHEFVETIRALLAQTTVSAGEANSPQSLPSPRGEQGTKTAQEAMVGNEDEHEVNNYE